MSKLIFFVDDDKMIINLLEYTFQSREQYEVKSFNTGEECLDSFDQSPDLVVLDHRLSSSSDSSLTGMDTLLEIREIDKEVPVIILTAYGTQDLLNEFMENGASRFLTKDDYFIDSLIDTIGEILV